MPEFPYRAVEHASAAVYDASDNRSLLRLRACISFLQKENVIGRTKDVKAAHGHRRPYDMEHIELWLCCLELMELGVPALTAMRLVIAEWRRFGAIFRLAEKTVTREGGEGDVVLLLPNVRIMSGNWNPGPGFPGVPEITHCTLGELPGRMAKATKPPGGGRVLMTNVSSLLRRFHEGLASAPMTPRRRGPGKKTGRNNPAKRRSKRGARKRA